MLWRKSKNHGYLGNSILMKLLKFICQKIIIVEVMLIILFLAQNIFGVTIPIISSIIHIGLTYLTPIAIIALILYFILSLLSFKIIEIALGVILGGLILYYLLNH